MKNCLWCKKEVNNMYCNASCQLRHEYKTGKRDRKETVKKAQSVAHQKQKINNWLTSKKSRDALRKVMQTEKYRKLQSELKKGEKNGMWNNTPWNKLTPTKKPYCAKDFVVAKTLRRKLDNNTCVQCGVSGEEKTLQCDHIVPYRVCKHHEIENLQMLCESCHSTKTQQDVKYMKKIGVLA